MILGVLNDYALYKSAHSLTHSVNVYGAVIITTVIAGVDIQRRPPSSSGAEAWRTAAYASSVTLTADVGSWTQTCLICWVSRPLLCLLHCSCLPPGSRSNQSQPNDKIACFSRKTSTFCEWGRYPSCEIVHAFSSLLCSIGYLAGYSRVH